ncbi:MAG: acyl-CoA dehydrogenase family protein [Acetobacteraceae bacterium]|nr:acyl-CoA dehydrogenase family protein [Acetobacteraceae bacterium]
MTDDLLRATASRLFGQYVEPPVLSAAERGEYADAAWNAIEEAGLTAALLPEEAGGYGVAVADALGLVRLAGEHALPLPLPETLLASWLLGRAGIPVPQGPLTFACARNLRRSGSGRFEGTLERVPWGRRAAGAAVLVPAEPPQLALIFRSAWNVSPGENLAREPRDDLQLTRAPEAFVPAPIEETGLRAAGAVIRCLQIAGALTRIVEVTTQYAQERVQFGRRIGKFQAVQQNLAVMAGQAAAASAAADLAVEAFADGLRRLPIAAAKARAGEAAGIAAAMAHQIHGAIGFTYEHRLHFFTKRLWSWRDEYGNEAEWNRLLGRHLAHAGASRLWAEIISLGAAE